MLVLSTTFSVMIFQAVVSYGENDIIVDVFWNQWFECIWDLYAEINLI